MEKITINTTPVNGDDSFQNQMESIQGKISNQLKMNINLKFVPLTSLPKFINKTECQPRQGTIPLPSYTFQLPEILRKKITEGNKLIIEWLNNSSENQKLFLKDPVQSLSIAGLKFERADLKLLHRHFEDIKAITNISPGTEIGEINISVNTKGKVAIENENFDSDGNIKNCNCD